MGFAGYNAHIPERQICSEDTQVQRPYDLWAGKWDHTPHTPLGSDHGGAIQWLGVGRRIDLPWVHGRARQQREIHDLVRSHG
jgi:hypothetical protein